MLVLPAGSQATLTEVGVIPPTTNPETVPSCPGSPCLAVSRTTGFQVKVGTVHNPQAAPRAGTVVAWSIMLGKPNATQIKFFNANEGGPSTAGIAILRPQKTPNLTYKLIAQSPLVKLEPYFGKTAQFPLETTLAGQKGRCDRADRAFLGAGAGAGLRATTTSWRASRPKSQCTSTSTQTTQTADRRRQCSTTACTTARLTYSATLISTP